MLKYSQFNLYGIVNLLGSRRSTSMQSQGRSQVFIGGGASWGQINLSKNFSAKIDKTSLNFKIFQKVLKGLKLIFKYVEIKTI